MKTIRGLCLTLAGLMLLTSQAFAADYNFETPAPSGYYGSTSYEEVYGAQYNYGGINAVDFLDPLAENAVSTTTGATRLHHAEQRRNLRSNLPGNTRRSTEGGRSQFCADGLGQRPGQQ